MSIFIAVYQWFEIRHAVGHSTFFVMSFCGEAGSLEFQVERCLFYLRPRGNPKLVPFVEATLCVATTGFLGKTSR